MNEPVLRSTLVFELEKRADALQAAASERLHAGVLRTELDAAHAALRRIAALGPGPARDIAWGALPKEPLPVHVFRNMMKRVDGR